MTKVRVGKFLCLFVVSSKDPAVFETLQYILLNEVHPPIHGELLQKQDEYPSISNTEFSKCNF